MDGAIVIQTQLELAKAVAVSLLFETITHDAHRLFIRWARSLIDLLAFPLENILVGPHRVASSDNIRIDSR
jgi:hypothetical protein